MSLELQMFKGWASLCLSSGAIATVSKYNNLNGKTSAMLLESFKIKTYRN